MMISIISQLLQARACGAPMRQTDTFKYLGAVFSTVGPKRKQQSDSSGEEEAV